MIHINHLVGNTLNVVTREKPLFSFSAISDIHLHDNNSDAGYDDLVNLFRVLGNRIDARDINLKYIFCAGDIGMSGPLHELQTFRGIVAEKCPIDKANVFSCSGNHDQQHTRQEWIETMYDPSLHDEVTQDNNFVRVDGNFVFAFMSLAHQNDRSTTVSGRICYLDDNNAVSGSGTRQWLEDVVQMSKDKTLVLFMHFPLANRRCADKNTITIPLYDWATGEYIDSTVNVAETAEQWAGLLDRGGTATSNVGQSNYGFYMPSEIQDYSVKHECEEIVDILNQHEGGKTIVFSGHTHLVFETERFDYSIGKGFTNVNVAPVRLWDDEHEKYVPTNIVTVHIPSLNHPRMLSMNKSLKYKDDTDTVQTKNFMLHGVQGWTTISSSNPYRQPCQSWLVDVYRDSLVLKGFETQVCHDRKYGDILPNYIYAIDLKELV